MPDDHTRAIVPNGDRALIVSERGDDELTVIAQCMAALDTLDSNSAARAAHYVVERYPLIEVVE